MGYYRLKVRHPKHYAQSLYVGVSEIGDTNKVP